MPTACLSTCPVLGMIPTVTTKSSWYISFIVVSATPMAKDGAGGKEWSQQQQQQQQLLLLPRSSSSPSPSSYSSPGTAMTRLRGLGGDNGAPSLVTVADTRRHDHHFVLMCALQTLDPGELDSSLGFRLFLDGVLCPGYAEARSAARRRHSPGMARTLAVVPENNTEEPPTATATAAAPFKTILWDLCAGVRREVVAALTAQSESCRRLGWTGPFVALQVDSTDTGGQGWAAGGQSGGGGEEVCTASVSFVPEDFGRIVRLAIGARCFRGPQASHAKGAWIREVCRKIFFYVVCVADAQV